MRLLISSDYIIVFRNIAKHMEKTFILDRRLLGAFRSVCLYFNFIEKCFKTVHQCV